MTETAFTLGTWKGFTTYKCTLCQFDCMEEQQARDHFQGHFELKPDPGQRTTFLTVDPSGIIREVEVRSDRD